MRNSVRLLFWFCTVEPSSLNEATASCPSQDLSSFLRNPRVEEIFHPLLGEGSPDDLGGKPSEAALLPRSSRPWRAAAKTARLSRKTDAQENARAAAPYPHSRQEIRGAELSTFSWVLGFHREMDWGKVSMGITFTLLCSSSMKGMTG